MRDSSLKIRGGRSLRGAIDVCGAKNTILPCIAASLLTDEEIVFENVPSISDVAVMIEIAKKLGARVEWDRARHQLLVEAKDFRSGALDDELPGRLRGSSTSLSRPSRNT